MNQMLLGIGGVLATTFLILAGATAQTTIDHSTVVTRQLVDETQATVGALSIYVSPVGNDDGNLGLTPGSSVRTLARVNQILDEVLHFDEPSWSGGDIEVRIASDKGKYYHQSVVWTATNPEHSITFMPFYDDNMRPVFNGCTSSNETTCDVDYFFAIRKPGPTNLRFKYIRIERYDNGISFRGEKTASNESNSVYGCYFYRIGNRYTSLDGGVGALNISSSDFNRVENSHFINIENYPVTDGHLHAIYISHGSDENYIARNRFSISTGVALKLRDNNWFNVIEHNTFSANGNSNGTAGYTDIPQDNTPPEADEKSSCQNVFRYNVLDGKYDCSTRLPVFLLFPSALSADGDTCNDLINLSTGAPYRRLSTAGNTDDGVQCNND